MAALLLPVLALVSAGCSQPKATPEQCEQLFEHYLDLKTAGVDQALAERDAGAELAHARALARDDGRKDPDVVQVTTECREQVTQREVTCALAATSVRAWNDCIE